MATTKKTTKAKAKTTKKPVTKKTTVSKTTSKSVSSKAIKANAVPRVVINEQPLARQIKLLNVFSASFGLVLAVLAGFFMNHSTYQLFTGLLTKDELTSKTSTVFVPAIHAFFDIELRWAVVAIMVLSAVVPILVLTRWKNRYQIGMKAKVNTLRWIDMAIISALVVEVIALLSGVQDIMTLKLIGVFMVVTCLLGWLAQKQNAETKSPVWSAYGISLVTGLLPWVLIGTYAVSTSVYGLVRMPWYVYALYASTLLGFCLHVLNQVRQFKALQDYDRTERNALQISLFIKVAFAVILISGLLK